MPRTPAPDRAAFWRKLIARHASSGLTVGELCRQGGVSSASFYAWRQRLKTPPSAATPSSLVPVRIVADRGGGQIAIELADPIRVLVPPGCDAESLRVAISAALLALKGRSSC